MNDLLEIDGWKTARAGWRSRREKQDRWGCFLLLFEEGRSIHYARGVIELQSPRLPRVNAMAERFRIDSSARRPHLRLRSDEAKRLTLSASWRAGARADP
jgi:hypothetical protein